MTLKTHQYFIFGMTIDSAIPFLNMAESHGTPDVTIKVGIAPHEITDARIKNIRYHAGPDEFLLRVDNVAIFYVTKGSEITIERHPKATDHEILLFLMGSAMGALLHQRNILPLHGSAIDMGGKGIIFVGPSGIGKSTTAAGFQKKAYPLLADDICAVTALNGVDPKIIPGFSHLKLWSDTLIKLKEDKLTLNRVRQDPKFDKYFFPVHRASTQQVPVHAVFVLETTNSDEFNISELEGLEKIEPIIDNTFRPKYLEGLGGKSQHFKQCAAIASTASIFKVRRPQQGFKLEELMTFVEGYF